MIYWTFSGVIKEGMLGIPLRSEPLNIIGIGIFRITTYGKIVELRQQFNAGS